MIDRFQFDILSHIAEYGSIFGFPVKITGGTLRAIEDSGYTENGAISKKGLSILEPYRVKRAVFPAAESLMRGGIRAIDTMLDALLLAGIDDIYIVRGRNMPKGCFDKYPSVKFIDNDIYCETGSISSVIAAGELVRGAYILDAGLLLKRPGLIRRYQYGTNCLGLRTSHTDGRCFFTDDGLYVKGFSTSGGENCHSMIGISYWTDNDGARLQKKLAAIFAEPSGRKLRWDDAALAYSPDNYGMYVRECRPGDIETAIPDCAD